MTDATGSEQDDDLAAGIFPETGYEPGRLPRREFQPWHRPRKQFVRREQWRSLLTRLYSGRPATDVVRYLGLPGVDLLDLRYLHDEVCRPADRALRFIGFNTEAVPGSNAQLELNLSLDEVRRLPHVDPQSDVLPDDFRRLSHDQSIAWTRTLKLGPFDIVNIDLCDGVASDAPYLEQSMYKALAQLVALQAHNHVPWLLILTTRIGRGMFDPDAEARLIDLYRANVMSCADPFVEACRPLLTTDPSTIDPATCSDLDYLNVMIVALGKWLASLVQSHGPHKVELASTHGYRVDPQSSCEDLVSISMRFSPTIVAASDPLAPQPVTIDECRAAVDVAKRAAARKDLDGLLADNPTLYEDLVAETEALLLAARYDVASYREWLNGAAPG